MTGDWHTGRAAEHTAMTFLKNSGYSVEKITGRSRRFDIVAWKGEKTLFLVVRSAKRLSISSYPEQLAILSESVRTRAVPGEIQFWIYRRPGWSMYKIQSGGASSFFWREA